MVGQTPLVFCTVATVLVVLTLSAAPAQPADSTPSTHIGGYIGELRQYKVRQGESLIELARRFDLGYNEIRDANPGVDPVIPAPGTVVTIPSAWISPAVTERPSIVVNLAELRLYVFSKNEDAAVQSFPLGIGDEGADTPVGKFVIVEKIIDPSWHVPQSIRRQRPQLPAVVAPGARNPLGRHALRLSRQDILIHGTNRPWGIGRRSSHGCLRLYPRDIASLFAMAHKGMQVWIINQPVKVGTKEGRVFIELHCQGTNAVGVGEILHMMADRNLLRRIDMGKLVRAYSENKGYPIDITWTGK